MFAQMPLFVYRHFTGAVCATSSDGRFALFSASAALMGHGVPEAAVVPLQRLERAEPRITIR